MSYQPPSGKDAVQDHKKPCLCSDVCLGKEQLHSNRVCRFDLASSTVSQESAPLSSEVERLNAELRKWIDNGCTPPPSPRELAWYACTTCNARGVKLWREPHGGEVLKCATCLSPDKPVDERGQQLTECGQCSDQVNNWLPAVPVGDTFYGYSSVPPQCVGWWKGLPTYDAIAQERHKAEVYRKQMVEAERQRDNYRYERDQHSAALNKNYWCWQNDGTDDISSLTCSVLIQPRDLESILKRAETAEAELARHPVSIAEANELQDILRTLTNSGTALKTSARELVSAWIRQAHEIDELRGKLTDAKERLAKVRDAIENASSICEDDGVENFRNAIKVALAEGEG